MIYLKLLFSGKGKGGTGTLLTFGAVTVGAIGILAYAKTDSQFRLKLEEWIPGTDKAITVLFQEHSSYFEYLLEFFASLKDSLVSQNIFVTEYWLWIRFFNNLTFFIFRILELFSQGKNKEGCNKSQVDCKNLEIYRREPLSSSFSFLTHLKPQLNILIYHNYVINEFWIILLSEG